MKPQKTILLLLLITLAASDLLRAEDGIVVTKNRADEPLANTFSAQKSIVFIERSVSRWQTRNKCITCHTNGLHLVAGSVATPKSEVLLKNREFSRKFLSSYVQRNRKPESARGTLKDIEGIVAGTSFLTISEMNTAKKLHPDTEAALDFIWTRQSKSGAWDSWLKCHWAPFEVDNHFGASLAAIALAMTPDAYRKKPASIRAWQKLEKYFKANPPASVHQKSMLLWLSRYAPESSTPVEKKKWLKELRALQQDDGGWVLIQLGNADWKRKDKQPQAQISDGYATAFVIYALRQSGVLASDPAIKRGIAWLKTHQRKSGRWFTHSPHGNGRHYITQAASNMALLALSSCGELSTSAGDPPFVPLFNGKDLTNFQAKGVDKFWRIEDGVLIGENDPKKRGHYLWTTRKYSDFILDFDAKWKGTTKRGVDTGIELRKPKLQLQLGISGSLRVDMTGSFYAGRKGYPKSGQATEAKRLLNPEGEWNSFRLQAKGNTFSCWINGKKASEYTDATFSGAAPLALQIHGGVVMKVEFRNLRIADLAAGEEKSR